VYPKPPSQVVHVLDITESDFSMYPTPLSQIM
jgi:hypothetical protein